MALRRALGRARRRARPNLAGCGEVTSPLFSITSTLNANWYNMAKSFETRVKTLEHSQNGPACRGFADMLREARRRVAAGDPISAEMMEDPVDGEFWRNVFKARARARFV